MTNASDATVTALLVTSIDSNLFSISRRKPFRMLGVPSSFPPVIGLSKALIPAGTSASHFPARMWSSPTRVEGPLFSVT